MGLTRNPHITVKEMATDAHREAAHGGAEEEHEEELLDIRCFFFGGGTRQHLMVKLIFPLHWQFLGCPFFVGHSHIVLRGLKGFSQTQRWVVSQPTIRIPERKHNMINVKGY